MLTVCIHWHMIIVPFKATTDFIVPFIIRGGCHGEINFRAIMYSAVNDLTDKGSAVQVLNHVLKAFSEVSGIQLNLDKCALVPFNLSTGLISSINSVFQATVTNLPLTYLGLPLTATRPDKLAFQKVIDKLHRKLAGWKSPLLSRAGRVLLASSVLSAIPIFFMSAFKLPSWLCTSSSIASGRNTSFWYYNWGGSCLSYFGSAPNPPKRFISLRQALPLWHKLLPSPLTIQRSALSITASNLIFSGQPDSLLWNKSSHGCYSASSAYKFFITSGKVMFPLKFIWKIKIPPSLKFFLLLLAHNRVLTQDQLLKRHVPVTPGCVLCLDHSCETASHLFFFCPFSKHLWLTLGFNLDTASQNFNRPIVDQILDLFTPDLQKRVFVATTLWALWRERNNRTFRQESRRLDAVHHWIVTESTLFLNFC
ncbi:hypothetical protein LUZ63_019330 [Rhynchospora breviuscula]|uniref:Reverse transcriptase zinc-binding domain-containing protein n=1 Tax=Rhynchospora breviuscula TaxID=2022672 RepID=A0A9Q0C612_9POAL|nr:hypothetical protein LUZ63_019330 [Rhynchospora breviuscula]